MPDELTLLPADRLRLLPTPCLVLDEARMLRNIDRLRSRLDAHGVTLRPHLKTTKSIEVARRVVAGDRGPAAVSTLKEAEAFAAAGITDLLYAVGIAPQKLERVVALRAAGSDLCVLLDSAQQADAVAAASRAAGAPIPALIEINCDRHRGGMLPGDPALVAVGRILHEGGAELRGVLVHAGGSYDAVGSDAHAAAAECERAASVAAAAQLRSAGLPCPVVSTGSTPTAHAARDLSGVTEVRAGVYVFFDLSMARIGVCSADDIAISVLTTIIGHQRERGWILIDAGWMALSRDLGAASTTAGDVYGRVCDIDGRVIPGLVVAQANQEHGIIAVRAGSGALLPDLPIGTQLRILPNHACATSAQFDGYYVIPAEAGAPLARWPRFSGW